MLATLMKLVTQVICDTRSKNINRAADLKQAAEMHRKIYRAIRDRNPPEAREAMREYLISAQKALKLEEIKNTESK
jgi:GntR family transcriptional repressor for pyruvate dehydrogenase complex